MTLGEEGKANKSALVVVRSTRPVGAQFEIRAAFL